MIDIGIGDFSEAYSINAAGQAVGQAVVDGSQVAFYYDGTTTHNLGTLGGTRALAAGINDLGYIVGTVDPDWSSTRAMLYRNGTVTVLPTLGSWRDLTPARGGPIKTEHNQLARRATAAHGRKNLTGRRQRAAWGRQHA